MIDNRDIQTLRELIQWWRQVKVPVTQLIAKQNDPKRVAPIPYRVKAIKAPENGIPARVGSTPGGPVECIVLDTNNDGDIVETTEVIDVYNQVTLVVLDNGERLGMAAFHPDAKWWAIVGDCNDTTN